MQIKRQKNHFEAIDFLHEHITFSPSRRGESKIYQTL